ncbi:MAG: hypothetical protein PVJ67_02760 [Candidatus Pacearchaeota archaeon]|jgi:hypothetical protein
MGLKKLIEERENIKGFSEILARNVVEVLSELCSDTVKLFCDEHLHFQVGGMNAEEVRKRFPKMIQFKPYGISYDELRLITTSDVKLGLEYASSRGDLIGYRGGYSIKKTSSQIIDEAGL